MQTDVILALEEGSVRELSFDTEVVMSVPVGGDIVEALVVDRYDNQPDEWYVTKMNRFLSEGM